MTCPICHSEMLEKNTHVLHLETDNGKTDFEVCDGCFFQLEQIFLERTGMTIISGDSQ